METVWIALTQLVLLHTVTASMVNVALRKPVTMSSSIAGYRASTAVDGDTDAEGYGGNKIIDTGGGHPFAWWKVDLQREVQDATVRIYFRTDYKKQRNGVEFYTSTSTFPTLNATSQGQLCRTVTGDPSGSNIPDVYDVTCLGRWRYLLLYTDTDNDGRGPILDFGEVEVLACSFGTYGEDCNMTCNSRNCVTMTTMCVRDGRCPNGCQPGWTGIDCTHACNSGSYGPGCSLSCSARNCVDASSPCDYVTGQCVVGCKAGYRDTDCRIECVSGYYGPGCSLSCSARNCFDASSPCDHVTGQCIGGCKAGSKDTDCTKACDSGYYGPGCSLSCSARNCVDASSPCDHVTGQCVGCKAGYRHTDCRIECPSGLYGPGCNTTCGKCSSGPVCDHVTGNCGGGCESGWMTSKCDQVSSETFKDQASPSVALLVGAVVGSSIVVLLLCIGIHLVLIRQGRLQWVKSPDNKKDVQMSPDNTEMGSIHTKPADEHAHSSHHVYHNDYAVLDSREVADNKEYDIIQNKIYQNI